MTIEDRLRHLEQSNRRLRGVLVILGLVVAACGGTTAIYDTVRVRELVIIDADEKPLAYFVGSSSGAALSVVTPSGQREVVLDRDGLRR